MQTSSDTDKKIPVQTLAELGPLPMKVALGCSALLPVSFALSWGFTNGWDLFAFSYLQSTFFFLSISLGALFFVMIQQLTRAGWSVVLRRLSEFISMGVIPLAVLVLPIVLLTLMIIIMIDHPLITFSFWLMMMVIDHPLIIYCSIAADEELWDDGSFPHYMLEYLL